MWSMRWMWSAPGARQPLGLLPQHGIGGRQDLPLPLSHVIGGATVALLVSFLALVLLWRSGKLQGAAAGLAWSGPLQGVIDGRLLRGVARLAGAAAVGFVAVAAVFGPDNALNPTAYAIFVLFWVGVPFASILLGPVWRVLNPLRPLHRGLARLAAVDPVEGMRPLPAWIGYWPAAFGLFAFVTLELVLASRDTTSTLRIWFGVYAAAHLAGSFVFGARWFDRCDAFEVYSDLVGRFSVLGRRGDGRLVLRNPLDGLAAVPAGPGLVAVISVLLGSTAFDGFTGASVWARWLGSTSWNAELLTFLGLCGMIILIAVTYTLAVRAAGWLGSLEGRPLPALFAHSMVPIIAGYVVAHYFSFLVFAGQQALILLSDPLVNGANLFGTATGGVNYSVLSGGAIAGVQVAAVVTGHVIGVVLAHDRAVSLFPRREAIRGQLPLLLLMVGYTVGGLLLLFSS